jgi:hypothetical protein
MKTRTRFEADTLTAVQGAHVIGIRVGTGTHRFIALWTVVVDGRVFVRSWAVREDGWYRTLVRERRGAVQVGGHEIPIRAVFTRSERLKDAVSRAYRQKYTSPGSIRFVRDLGHARSRATTTELVPAE